MKLKTIAKCLFFIPITYAILVGYQEYNKDELVFSEKIFTESEVSELCEITKAEYHPSRRGIRAYQVIPSKVFLTLNCPTPIEELYFFDTRPEQIMPGYSRETWANLVGTKVNLTYSSIHHCLLTLQAPFSFVSEIQRERLKPEADRSKSVSPIKCQQLH